MSWTPSRYDPITSAGYAPDGYDDEPGDILRIGDTSGTVPFEPGKLVPTPTDETRKRLWVDVFYRGVQEIHCSADPAIATTEAAHRADLAVAEYDQRFGAGA